MTTRSQRRAPDDTFDPSDFGAQGFGGSYSWGGHTSSGSGSIRTGWHEPDGGEPEAAEPPFARAPGDERIWPRAPRIDYRGKGPKGWRRSDERIKEEVCERLQEHGAVDASDLEVDVKDGVVTLAGTVAERAQKRCAEYCTEAVSGVVDVENRIKVKPGEGTSSWGWTATGMFGGGR